MKRYILPRLYCDLLRSITSFRPFLLLVILLILCSWQPTNAQVGQNAALLGLEQSIRQAVMHDVISMPPESIQSQSGISPINVRSTMNVNREPSLDECYEGIVNGGFEEDAAWALSPETHVGYSTAYAYSGARSMFYRTQNNTSAGFGQVVSIPIEANRITLGLHSLLIYFDAGETISVVVSDATTLEVLYSDFLNYSALNTWYEYGLTLPAAQLVGRDVLLSFLTIVDNDIYYSEANFDDVSLFICTPSNTPIPTSTHTSIPTATHTPVPTATDTSRPPPTNTPIPSATITDTPLPPTHTSTPTVTNTKPPSTNTSVPTATNTSRPPSTSTFTPTATNTSPPLPTHTPTVTSTRPPSQAGDIFESDDSCAESYPIPDNGRIQEHTFHQQSDADWVHFDAIEGTTYIVEVRSPADSPADTILELYDSCDRGATLTQDHSFSPDVHLHFTASSSGKIYLKLLNHSANLFGDHVRYQLSVRKAETEQLPGALIIVAGRIAEGDSLQENIHNVTNRVYTLWRNQGYAAERIRYLATDQSLDADRDGQPDVDGLPSVANLRDAITIWALDKVDAERALTLYIMDHGAYDKLYLDEPRGERLRPEELDQWLTQLEEQIAGLDINVIIEACNSGSFIDPGQSISKEGRVVITSAGARTLAWASGNDGAHFSDAFLDALSLGNPLYLAFNEASDIARSHHPDQIAWLDDDGDGLANEDEDGQVAVTRSFSTVGSLNTNIHWLPYVAEAEVRDSTVTASQATSTLARNSGKEIWTEVRDDSRVESVWAVIYPPSYQAPTSSEELVRSPLPIPLHARGNNQYATGTTDEFDEFGDYRIVIHAKDEDGFYSRPKEIRLNTGMSIFLPMVER